LKKFQDIINPNSLLSATSLLHRMEKREKIPALILCGEMNFERTLQLWVNSAVSMNDFAKPDASQLRSGLPKWVKDLDRLVRGEATNLSALRKGIIEIPSDRLQIAIVVLGIIYGMGMGCFSLLKGDSVSFLQFFSGMVKVPSLFLLTLVVTFPSLYVFNALVGSRLSAVALWRLLIASVAVTMAVLASLGPIVAFFSLSTTSYSFMLLLNVLVFGTAGLLGLKFLIQTLHRLALTESNDSELLPPALDSAKGSSPLDQIDDSPAMGPRVRFVFRCWMILFALVGAQMSWVLRPFLGNPEVPFSVFRSRESNFFEAVWQHLTRLFG
jgi:hypothetical protein